MSYCAHYQAVRDEIASAAKRCGREPSDIALVAVTKQVGWHEALFLYNQGQRDFGENCVTHALMKKKEAPSDCRWHFLGHLQKNKIRKVVGQFALIHSVHTLDLAKQLARVSRQFSVITPILLQANTSGEASKQGLSSEEWKQNVEELLTLEGISIQGLMTMAPLGGDEKGIRHCFSGLRKLRDELNAMAGERAYLHHLSMGMSKDFTLAIEEGATIIRIGTALFQ
jgi:PLP dependent protein